MKKGSMARARETLAKHAASTKRRINHLTGDLFTVGTAYATGYVYSRWPEATVVGDVDLPIPLVLAAKVTAFTEILGPTASHSLHAVGTGVASGYATIAGYELGEKHRAQDNPGMRAITQPQRQPVAA